MLGLMQDRPLLIADLIEHAARHHGDVEIVPRRVEGDIRRTTYARGLAPGAPAGASAGCAGAGAGRAGGHVGVERRPAF